jgi:excisionase family DNA binding protein
VWTLAGMTSALLLSSDVARILDCSPDYVRSLERAGRLIATKTAGGTRLFRREDVEQFARMQHHTETRKART